jgi:hypothetical protein
MTTSTLVEPPTPNVPLEGLNETTSAADATPGAPSASSAALTIHRFAVFIVRTPLSVLVLVQRLK